MLCRTSIALSCLVLSLLACATPQQNKEYQLRYENSIPTCNTEQSCKEKWSAAQAWVVSNCGMKIQLATDTIIETYNPGTTMNLAARVIKEPLGNGRYRLTIRTWCGNVFGCQVKPWEAAINFNEYVGRFGN